MERTNPVNNRFFDFEQYKNLLENVGKAAKAGDEDAAGDIKDITKAFDSFHNYVMVVDSTETAIRVAMARLEGQDMRDAVERYDSNRRYAHNAAIASTSLVNNLAKFYGCGAVFLGDKADRYQVADFCLEVTDKLFSERRL